MNIVNVRVTSGFSLGAGCLSWRFWSLTPMVRRTQWPVLAWSPASAW